MREYQPFSISNFRTGFDEAVEPWLLPRDAYQRVINAHLYRGVLEKIEGYSLFATMSYRNLATPTTGVVNGINKTFTFDLSAAPPTTSNFYGYGTIIAGTSTETFSYSSDATATLINLLGSAAGTGTVNLTTNIATLIFNTAPPISTYTSILFAWDSASLGTNAIMGIKQYFANDGSQEVMVFDQDRVGIITNLISPTMSFAAGAINGISEIPHSYYETNRFTGGGGVLTYTSGVNATALHAPFIPGTLEFIEYDASGNVLSRIVDNGVGSFTSQPNVASGSVNYATGDFTITFTNSIDGHIFDSQVGVYGTLFTGTISNFFSLYNYQFKAFFTNNKDPIMYYDGFSLKYLNTDLSAHVVTASSGVPAFDITRCLHVFVNQERLELIAPFINTLGINAVNSIYWSVSGNPLDFITINRAGNLQASTSEPIRTFGYINTDQIVRFADSERVFRYTGDAFAPFRWDSTNNSWGCDAQYTAINYDTYFTSIGKTAIIGSDGVNAKRVDEIIPDFTLPTRLSQQLPVPFMNQTSIGQCYGERFDDFKEGWICYNSAPEDQSSATASDNILSFNYLDETYAIYSFPFSCLGYGKIANVPTWSTTYTLWEADLDTWSDFDVQEDSRINLAGDQYDRVFELQDGNFQTNVDGDVIPVAMDVISKNFNPFIEQGQLGRLGYIDLFVSANQDSKLYVQFYLNDQIYIDASGVPQGYYQETVLTFSPEDAMSPTTNQIKVWKRIYVGSVGKAHTIRFYQNLDDLNENPDQPIYVHAMVLYMKPAGRIFN